MKTTRDITEVKRKDVCMRLALVCAVVLFCLVSVTGPIWAGCPTQHRDCVTDYGKGKDVGKASVMTCWKWGHLQCEFCGGNKQPVENCRKKYPDQCRDKCWSCDGGKHGCCMDKDGNAHGNCNEGGRLKFI